MNATFAALAACLVIGGCAQYGTRPPAEPDVSSPIAGTTSSGTSAGGQQAAGGPRGPTRAQVHAEAVEAVRHYQSTIDEERAWFNPFMQQH